MNSAMSRRTYALIIAPMLLFVFATAFAQADLSLPLLWKTDVQMFTESGATVSDITGDGIAEVIVAGRDDLIAIEGTGKELWRYRARGRYMTYPAVLAREGQPTLIYAADNSGQMSCLDGSGKVVWQKDLAGPSSWSAAVVCDLEADGKFEVIQTDETGLIWAFDALSGDVRWLTNVKGMPVSPAVADVDGDGKVEIAIVTGDGILSLLDAAGGVKWTYTIGGTSQTWGTSAPVIFRASDGACRIVAASNEGQVFCFAPNGGPLWNRPTNGAVASAISVGDMDADGVVDVFVVTQIGVIHRFDETGKPLWAIDTQGRSLAAGALIDLTGDGNLEFLLATQSGHLMVFDAPGNMLFDKQFDHRTINVTPAFGDVTPATPGLEMILTGGEAGLLYCFRTPAKREARGTWTAYRGDEHKSGAWIRTAEKDEATASAVSTEPSPLASESPQIMSPVNLSSEHLLAGENVRFAIANPGNEPVVALAACKAPDGFLQSAITCVFGERGELQLPMNAAVEGGYHFTWSLYNKEGKRVASGASDLPVVPFVKERQLAEQALKSLDETAAKLDATLPLAAAGLRQKRGSLQLACSAAEPDYVEVVRQAKRALRLCELASGAAALGPATSLLPFENTLWESRAVDSRLPETAATSLRIARRVALGEHEPVSLGLFNPLARDVQARVVLDNLKEGPAVTFHRSVPTPTSLGETSWDALPELDESSVITVPSLESAELWLDIDTSEVQPGEHTFAVRVLAMNGAGVEVPRSPQAMPPPETKIEIALTVLPFELAPSGVLRLCAWASLTPACVRDMLAHGNNVFIGPHATPQYDAQGKLTGIDYTALDKFLEPLIGYDVVPLLSGFPAVHGEVGSPDYIEQLRVYFDGLVPHLAAKGFGVDSFALYPVDEPGGLGWNAVNQVVAFGKAVKALRPDIMLYVDGGGEAPLYEAMAPYTDIWCPGITMLAEDSPTMQIVRKDAKHLWSYDCGYSYSRPSGPNIKNINIVGQFRTAALFAFRHNATGIGYWSYNIGEDPWGRNQMEYTLVYPGTLKPVTSRRWEAVREGIEDYRILVALRSRIDESAPQQLPDELRAKIQHLLDTSLPRMIDPSYEEVRVGLGRDALDFTNNDATINAFREEVLNCAEAVSKAGTATEAAP